MGCKRKRRRYVLQFSEGDLAGLEVRTKSAGMRQYLAIAKLSNVDRRARMLTEQSITVIEDLCEAFARTLESWNLEEEDGTPVPATSDSLMDLEPRDLFTIVYAWMDAVTGTSEGAERPASGGSGPLADGDASLEASLPVEPLESGTEIPAVAA